MRNISTCVASGTCACVPWRPTPFARPIRVNDRHGHQTQVPRTEKAHAEASNNVMQRRKRLSGCNPEEFQTLSNPQKISCIILRNLFGLDHQSCATDTLLLRKKIYPRQFSLNLKQRIIFMFLSISFTDFRSCMHHTYFWT